MKGLPIHLLGLRVHNLDLECVLWSNNAFFASQFRKNAKKQLENYYPEFFSRHPCGVTPNSCLNTRLK